MCERYAVGIDCSYTRLAAVMLCLRKGRALIVSTLEVETKPMDFPNRMKRIQHITSRVKDWHLREVRTLVDVYVIEGYAFGARLGRELAGELGGLVRREVCTLASDISRVYEVAPTTLKVFTTGNGHADKAAMMQSVRTRWGFDAPNDDVADAYALARVGCHLLDEDMKEHQAYASAVDKVREIWPKEGGYGVITRRAKGASKGARHAKKQARAPRKAADDSARKDSKVQGRSRSRTAKG